MRRALYKYYSDLKWAEALLDGEVFFRSLSYFRNYEDANVRRDRNEGTAVFRPEGGLIGYNHTQGKSFVLPHHSFESSANQEEIFVFCTSRSLSEELRIKFEAAVCVEILRIGAFCHRIKAALPSSATFSAGCVQYYKETEGGSPRWALPDMIATSKLDDYSW